MTQLKVKCKIVDCKNGMLGLSFECEGETLRTYKYLTADKERLCSLADKINRFDVSLIHIEEIIDDFLE